MMNELDRAIQMYRAAHPEKERGSETISELLAFLVERVEWLQERAKNNGQARQPLTPEESQARIDRAMAWARGEGLVRD